MTEFIRPEPGSRTAWPVARPGLPLIFAAGFVTLVLALLGLRLPALFALAATLGICYFFRDPDRVVPMGENLVVAPADGKVIVAQPEAHNPFFEGACVKLSIFMTVFNVHVNRLPHEGRIEKISYAPGSFFNASRRKASQQNEYNALVVATKSGQTYCVVQIAGWVARRIICDVQTGQRLKRGQRFGMICFGSRLDLYLPPESTLKAALGDRVRAGTSVVGYLP